MYKGISANQSITEDESFMSLLMHRGGELHVNLGFL